MNKMNKTNTENRENNHTLLFVSRPPSITDDWERGSKMQRNVEKKIGEKFAELPPLNLRRNRVQRWAIGERKKQREERENEEKWRRRERKIGKEDERKKKKKFPWSKAPGVGGGLDLHTVRWRSRTRTPWGERKRVRES